LVSDRLHIIDASHMTAKVDLFPLKKDHRDGDDYDHYVDRNSPDPDARFGRKIPKKAFYGYKCHVVQDADFEFIVQALDTPGNVADSAVLPQLAQPQAQELTGDKAYDSKANRAICPPWGSLLACTPVALDLDDLAGPGGNAPRSSESSPNARSFTVCAKPATGACPR
jgi:hypothetical protein